MRGRKAEEGGGGKLGGREVDVIVQDDELKPDVAVGKVKAFVELNKVDFVVGPIFSNILGAIMKPVTDAGVILISPNAGSSAFAGKQCNPNFFVTSYQNDQVHEVLGQYAQDSGIKKVIVGESITFPGAPEFMRANGVEVVDVEDPDCIEMMRRFIHEHPDLWNEDIGK